MLKFKFYRRKIGAFMGTIAKRLVVGTTAAAPEINPRFKFDPIGTILWALCFAHVFHLFLHGFIGKY